MLVCYRYDPDIGEMEDGGALPEGGQTDGYQPNHITEKENCGDGIVPTRESKPLSPLASYYL